jgi:hypothetical protein
MEKIKFYSKGISSHNLLLSTDHEKIRVGNGCSGSVHGECLLPGGLEGY